MSQLPSILDAHVHLYDPTRVHYPWMSKVPQLDKPHLPKDYWAQASGCGIEACIWVEVNAGPGEYLGEARLTELWRDMEPRLTGMIASVPLDRGPIIERYLQELLYLRGIVGLRTLIETHVEELGWALREPFVNQLRHATGPEGPAFDLCVRANQLSEVTQLASLCPETTFVLDHCGKPEIGGDDEAGWQVDLSALAAQPNTFCKLSGLATEVASGPPTAQRIKPYLEHAVAAFGPERVMFASDWPICTLAMPLKEWVALVHDVAEPLGADALHDIFWGTANRAYRLGRREQPADSLHKEDRRISRRMGRY
ncbi:MAG: amidohydrolase family protein [Pseudomonadota bacterium]